MVFAYLFRGFLGGFMIFIVLPFIVSALTVAADTLRLPELTGVKIGAANKVSAQYLDFALAFLERALLVKRSHGGFALKKSEFVTNIGAGKERIMIGGNNKYFSDPHGYMSTFRGRIFGLAHEDREVIVNPRVSDLGTQLSELKSKGEFIHESNGEEYVRAFFHLDEGDTIVDMDGTLSVIQGSAQPGDAVRTMDFIKLSQEGFNTRNIVDYTAWLAALAVPFGLMLLASKVSTGGGAGMDPTTVGLQIGVML